ncbi:2-oxo acid dehydrogenase subunit E2 [Christensenellaceae bacterium OttesenSCG-928-M15]|nr:2-oxo acid dehydrogenase subunit E2 [Christensenellaceae bacterium OttesenSCG-928-M15]
MANAVLMPKMGLTMTEGVVTRWLKNEGDAVKEGEPLFELETDKLVNEVNSEYTGTLLKIIAQEGDTVPCIETIAYIGEPGEKIEEAAASAPAAPAKEESKSEAPKAAPAASAAAKTASGYVLASPAAKQLAKDRGIDLHEVNATGPDGAVLLRDVEAHQAKPARTVRASGLAAKIAQELGMDLSALAGDRRVLGADVLRAALNSESAIEDETEKLTGMRKTISRRMTQSWQTSPRVCYEAAVNCTNMKHMRKILKKEFENKGVKLTFNHIIMLAVTKALIEHPNINASLDGDLLIRHAAINIGLAVGVENGLLVPNLKGCEVRGLMSIAKGTQDMIARARDGSIAVDELSGGTFTITNLGMYGVRSFSPVINQPELAILGVTAMVDTPVVDDDEIVIRPMMNLNLVADHRVIDGVLAASFLRRVVELLESPAKLVL